MKPKVTLVGAGPGDSKLLTLRGAEALIDARVVLYDALVDPEVLKYAATAEQIYVGKRKGNHALKQEEINHLLVSKAFEKGAVVRLKGGDPFVFGRGGEEVDYVQSFGIETEVVPGISSATSVPSRLGISLTKRKVAQSFWVITGTTSDRKLSSDFQLAAQTTATLVVLMGMSNLDRIASIVAHHRGEDTPVAIVQNGFMAGENHAVGTASNIVEIVKDKRLTSPAIIVIGEVVRHSTQLNEIYQTYAIY